MVDPPLEASPCLGKYESRNGCADQIHIRAGDPIGVIIVYNDAIFLL